jgi:hypothetical protein
MTDSRPSKTYLPNGETDLRACPDSPAQAETPVPPEVCETASNLHAAAKEPQ